MFIALSFIGQLPEYIIFCIHQIRLFFDGEIYLIVDDLSSPYLEIIRPTVHIIPYTNVMSEEWAKIIQEKRERFAIIDSLGHRRELFLRSFERFFLLKNLMKQLDRGGDGGDGGGCLFLEIDVMIYEDPRKFAEQFAHHEICFTFDNIRRASGCYTFVRSAESLDPLLVYMTEYIYNSPRTEYINEMTALYNFAEIINRTDPNFVHYLPVYWPTSKFHNFSHKSFKTYQSIFDAQPIGVYLFGMDIVHSGNKIQKGLTPEWTAMNYTNCQFRWERDELGRNIPYIQTDAGDWVRINNLHIHSKDLLSAISAELLPRGANT
jgi:hypothetical protein